MGEKVALLIKMKEEAKTQEGLYDYGNKIPEIEK
jgi:hypothetical protein